MRCTFCGCTEDRACEVRVNHQPDEIRDDLEQAADRAGAPVPTVIGCSWISIDPPVCSAPKCRQEFARQLAEVR